LENSQTRHRPVNRWLVLLFFVLSIIAATIFPPIAPHIQVAPEVISAAPLFSLPVLGNIYLTNTLVASFIVYLSLIGIAFIVRRAIASGEMVPRGFAGAMEAGIEALYNGREALRKNMQENEAADAAVNVVKVISDVQKKRD